MLTKVFGNESAKGRLRLKSHGVYIRPGVIGATMLGVGLDLLGKVE
jgi:hypothetical protein